jgi:prevent-host-death family protein
MRVWHIQAAKRGQPMETTIISSDQARKNWREMLDTVASGESIIIERYGKPTAVLIPYQDFLTLYHPDITIREAAALYRTDQWAAIKTELAAEIKADLLTEPDIQHALLQYERRQLQQHEMSHLEEEFADYEQRYPLTDVRN